MTSRARPRCASTGEALRAATGEPAGGPMTEAVRPPRYVVLEITNRCNLRCRHCASSSGLARANELTLREIRDLLGELRALGTEEVTLIGGEALLRRDWSDIAESVVATGARLLLITNGLLLADDERALGRLRELRPYLVGVSLDGADRARYERQRGVDGFDRVVRLLERLVGDGTPHVNAITTFSRDNLGDFDELAERFRDSPITWQVQLANLGGDRFDRRAMLSLDDYSWFAARVARELAVEPARLRLKTMDDFGYFPLDPALAFLHAEWGGCAAGVEVVGIRSNGDMLGCLSLGDEFVVGNVRPAGFAAVWQAEQPFAALRHKERHLSGHCASCPVGARCRAGCTAMAYSATGSIGCNPYCLRHLECRGIVDGLDEALGAGPRFG